MHKLRLSPIAAVLQWRRSMLAGVLLAPAVALAGPSGGAVVAGQASIARPDATQTVVHQTSSSAVVDWDSFSTSAGETVRFEQPSASAAVLNRVTGGAASELYGSLQSNGRVFLINPQGVLFGAGSQVNVGGLVATTMNVTDEDFMSGRLVFSGDSNAAVTNRGELRAADGGFVVLAGGRVSNEGLVSARLGKVVLASGSQMTLDVDGRGLVAYAVGAPAQDAEAGVANSGEITADGGQVVLTASGARDLARASVNNSGRVQARSIEEHDGEIILSAADGSVELSLSGELDASALGDTGGGHVRIESAQQATVRGGISTASMKGRGGRVEVLGEQVTVTDRAEVSAHGADGGGQILIGGGWQGRDPLTPNARQTYVGAWARIDAGADEGDGGKVVVWSDETTRYYGNISARGHKGGAVEVSGKLNLDFRGGVDLTGMAGQGGSLLLDPRDIHFVASAGPDTPANQPDGTPDVAESAGGSADFSIDTAGVQGYSELFLQASRDIYVDSALDMGGNSLRLEAGNDINISSNLNVGGAATLTADADASGAGAIVHSGGAVSLVNGTLNGDYHYNGGSFAVGAGGVVTANDAFNWNTTSALGGAGTLRIASGATFNINAQGSRTVNGLRIENLGTVTSNMYGGGYGLYLDNGAYFDNAGLFALGATGNNDQDAIATSAGSGTLRNTGTIRMDNGDGSFTLAPATFINDGGTLQASAGGALLLSPADGQYLNSVSFAGANVRLSGGNHAFANGVTLAGQVNQDGGAATFTAVSSGGIYNYNGGSLTLNGTFTANGGLNWNTTASIAGPGLLKIPIGQTFNINGSGSRTISGVTVQNLGTTVSNMYGGGHALRLNDGAYFDNSGLLSLDASGNNDQDAIATTSGGGTLRNTGTIRMNNVDGSYGIAPAVFINTGGTLQASAGGALLLGATDSQYNTSTSFVGNSVALSGGNHVFANGIALSGVINHNGGAASFTGATHTGTYNYNGGSLTLNGLFTLNGSFEWNVASDIAGSGTLKIPSGSVLDINGPGGRAISGLTVLNLGTTVSNLYGGGYALRLTNGALFDNVGVLELNSTGNNDQDGIDSGAGTGTLRNTGLIRMNAADGSYTLAPAIFINNGGTLQASSGGALLLSSVNSSYNTATAFSGDRVYLYAGSHAFSDGIALTGQINHNGGSVHFDDATSAGAYYYNGGSLVLDGLFVANGGFDWNTINTLAGTGILRNPAGKVLNVNGPGSRSVDTLRIENLGTANSNMYGGGYQLRLDNGAYFDNTGTLVLGATGNNDQDAIVSSSGTGTLRNTGTIRMANVDGSFAIANSVFMFDGGNLQADAGGALLLQAADSQYHANANIVGEGVIFNGGSHVFSDGIALSGHVNHNAGTMAFTNVTSNGLYSYNGGVLNISSVFTAAGGFDWNTVNMLAGGGTLKVPTGSTFHINGPGSRAISNLTVLNLGTTVSNMYGGGYALYLSDGAHFDNAGLFALGATGNNDQDGIATGAGTGTLRNSGTIRMDNVDGSYTIAPAIFINNAGTLQANSGGALLLASADSRFNTSAAFIGSNVYMTGGGHVFSDGVALSGQVNQNGGAVSFAGATSGGAYNYNGGSLLLDGLFVANGGFNWNTTSTLAGSGTLKLPSGSTFNINGPGGRIISGLTVLNLGTAVSNMYGGGHALHLNDGATFDNAGLFALSATGNNDQDVIVTSGGIGTLRNAGTIRMDNGDGSYTLTPSVFINDGGTLQAGGGALVISSADSRYLGVTTFNGSQVYLSGGAHQFMDGASIEALSGGSARLYGGSFSFGNVTANGLISFEGGSVSVNTGKLLVLNGGFDWLSGGSILNGGEVTLQAGNMYLPGDRTFDGGAFHWSGGSFSGPGQILVANGATFDAQGSGARIIDGQSFSYANLDVSSGSIEYRSGSLSVGVLTISAGASFILNSSGGYAGFSLGSFENDGTFSLLQGNYSAPSGSGTHEGLFSTAAGATLTLGGASQAFDGVDFSGAININTVASFSGASSFSGNVFLTGGSATFETGSAIDGILVQQPATTLVLRGATLRGTLQLGGALELQDTTAAVDQQLTVDDGGSLNWNTAASITGTTQGAGTGARMSVAGGGTVSLNHTGSRSLDGVALDNFGTVALNLTGADTLTLGSGTQLGNSGVIDFTAAGGGDDMIAGAALAIAANGVLRQSGGGNASINTAGLTLGSSSQLNLNSGANGTLSITPSLTLGGNASVTGGLHVNASGFTVAAGTALSLNGGQLDVGSGTITVNGDLNLGGGSVGAGTVLIDTVSVFTAHLNGAGTVTADVVNLDGGLASTGTFTINGALTQSGGTASLANTSVSGLTTLSGGVVSLGGTFSANGGFVWSGGSIAGIAAGATLLNPTGKTLSLSNGQRLAQGLVIQNNGSLAINGDGFLLLDGSSTLNNAGAMTLNTTATSSLGGGATGANALSNTGSIVNAGTNARIDGTLAFSNAGGVITHNGAGTMTVATATMTSTGGSFGAANGDLVLAPVAASGNSFSGDYTITGGRVYLGDGVFDFTGTNNITGTLNQRGVNSYVTFSALNLTGALNAAGQNFRIGSGSISGLLSISDPTSFYLDSGAVTANGGLAMADTNFGGAVIYGPGTLVLNGTSNLSGTSPLYVHGAAITNNGTLNLSFGGSTALVLQAGAVLNNAAGGTIAFTNTADGNDGIVDGAVGAVATLNNSGLIRNSDDSGSSFISGVNLVSNGGRFNAGSTTLDLGVASGAYSGAVGFSGSVRITAGAHTFASGAALTGALVQTGGTTVFSNVTSAGRYSLSGGTLNVGGTLSANGGFDWSGGSIAGAGSLLIPSAQTLTLLGSGNRVVDQALIDNAGTMDISLSGNGDALLLNNGATLHNTGAVVFTAAGGGNDAIRSSSGNGTLNNDGGAIRNAVDGATASIQLASVVSHGGTLAGPGGLSVRASSSFVLDGVNTLTGDAVIDFGAVSLGSGTVLDVVNASLASGTATIASGATVNLHANDWVADDEIVFVSGVLDLGTGSLTASELRLLAGELRGNGTVHVDTQVTNSGGTISPGASPGRLTIDGNYVQGHAGALRFEIGGVTPVTGYDVLRITGSASFDGTANLVLVNGYVPVKDDTFALIEGPTSISGNFATINKPAVLPALAFAGSQLVATAAEPVTPEAIHDAAGALQVIAALPQGAASAPPADGGAGLSEEDREEEGNTTGAAAAASGIEGPGQLIEIRDSDEKAAMACK